MLRISSYSFKYLNGNARVYPIMVVQKSGGGELKPKPTRRGRGGHQPTPMPHRGPEDVRRELMYQQFQEGFVYTVPLERRIEDHHGNTPTLEVVNAVIAFTCPSLATSYCTELMAQHESLQGPGSPCAPVEVELADLKHYSTILRLPLITVVNAFCHVDLESLSVPVLFDYQLNVSPLETFELYYYYKPQDVVGVPLSSRLRG